MALVPPTYKHIIMRMDGVRTFVKEDMLCVGCQYIYACASVGHRRLSGTTFDTLLYGPLLTAAAGGCCWRLLRQRFFFFARLSVL